MYSLRGHDFAHYRHNDLSMSQNLKIYIKQNNLTKIKEIIEPLLEEKKKYKKFLKLCLHQLNDLNIQNLVWKFIYPNSNFEKLKMLKNKPILYSCIYIQKEKIFNYFLEEHVVPEININIKNKKGRTALQFACFKGLLPFVEKLLIANANVNMQNNVGNTALILASIRQNELIVKHLLNYDYLKNKNSMMIDVNKQNQTKHSALIYAARDGNFKIVNELLKNSKINVNLQNEEQNSALIYACKYNRIDIVEALLENENIDLNLKNKNNETPLIVASIEGHYLIVTMLLEEEKNVIDINYQMKNNGNNALMYAAINNRINIVRILLQQDYINIHLTNIDGMKPLQLAVRRHRKRGKCIDIILLLALHRSNKRLRIR